ASLLAEVGVAGAVHVTADPVLALQAPGALPPRTAFPEAGGRPVCLICPRAFPGWPQTKPVLAAAASHLAGTFAAHIALLPLQPERDGAACRELREAIGGGASLVTPPARIGPLLSLIGAAELVVGVRLHALIFATVMGVGCLGIGYDPKVGNFLAELGQAPLPADAKGEDVMVGLERAWTERAALARRARELLPGLRARAGRTAELASSLLGGPGSGQD
ncbi:MAG: polysaccharide pyruvyl transferase family protein, partial [Bacillota bacterium]